MAELTVGLMLATVADVETGTMDTARVIDAARRAEAAGFDGVYVGDHLLHRHPILESIVTLAAIAASTDDITIGTCVLLAALRQPLVLAKQLGTLASFATDRLRIGVGVGGEYPEEFAAAGVPLERRGAQLDAALAELRSLLAAPDGAPPTVAPTADVPIVVGGWSDAALRRAAHHGCGWIGYLLDEGSFAARRAKLRDLDVDAAFTTGMLLPVHVTSARGDAARAEGAACWEALTGTDASALARHILAGPAEDVVAAVGRFAAAGCDEVILAPADQGPGYLAQVDRLAHEVVPQLRVLEA